MLTEIQADGYQSLRDAKIALGRLTVITGPSSSGKSALVRALLLLARNARGTSYISRGRDKCVVGVGCREEGWAVSITRGARGADAYRVAVIDPDGGDKPKVWDYTKLGGKVPDEAAQVLNLGPLNFAGQFDAPFLLTATAGDVAKMLGSLTNVTLIFAAAREAGRRKKALQAELKRAEAEVERLSGEAQRFASLPSRIEAVRQAEEALEKHALAQGRAQALEACLGRLGAAQQALAAVAVPPEPPDLSELEEAGRKIARLSQLLDAVRLGNAAQAAAEAGARREEGAIRDADVAIHKALEEAGTCPLCGQEVQPMPPGMGGAHAGNAPGNGSAVPPRSSAEG